MANTQAAFGGRPIRMRNGTEWTGAPTAYYVPATDGNAIFIGDPVAPAGSTTHSNANDITQIGAEYVPGALMTVKLASAGSSQKILGFCVGVMANDQTSVPYRAASTERIILVADDYNLIFQIQGDGSGTLGAATVGLNANLVSGTGNTTTGLSAWALDEGGSTAPTSGSTLQLYILRASNIPGNDVTSKYATWDVIINQHNLAIPVAGIA